MRKIPEKFVKFSLGLYQGDCADKTMYLPQTSLVMYRVGGVMVHPPNELAF